jgi:hypothetical protein
LRAPGKMEDQGKTDLRIGISRRDKISQIVQVVCADSLPMVDAAPTQMVVS